MFTKIMVPLDGSELAERALASAERLASLSGATLQLVRVVALPLTSGWIAGPTYLPASVYEEVLQADTKAATEYLKTIMERLATATFPVRAQVLTGNIASSLLDYEQETGTDLVIMTSHGRTGLARFALGSIADRLLRQGSAPVLLVRSFGTPVSMAQIVAPLDGSKRAEAVLTMVQHLAPALAHEVTLLRVIHGAQEGPEAERYLQDAAQHLHQEGLVCWSQVVQGDPAQAIIDVAGTDKLVVMATHGRSGVARWALGSVADRVARYAGAEVLLVRSMQGEGSASAATVTK